MNNECHLAIDLLFESLLIRPIGHFSLATSASYKMYVNATDAGIN